MIVSSDVMHVPATEVYVHVHVQCTHVGARMHTCIYSVIYREMKLFLHLSLP